MAKLRRMLGVGGENRRVRMPARNPPGGDGSLKETGYQSANY